MAGSTTEELPCQATEDAKNMAILLAGPSGEDPPEANEETLKNEPWTPARSTEPPTS